LLPARVFHGTDSPAHQSTESTKADIAI